MYDIPENFPERWGRAEAVLQSLDRMHSNGGCPAQQRTKARIDGLQLAAGIFCVGITGWLGWLTVLLVSIKG